MTCGFSMMYMGSSKLTNPHAARPQNAAMVIIRRPATIARSHLKIACRVTGSERFTGRCLEALALRPFDEPTYVGREMLMAADDSGNYSGGPTSSSAPAEDSRPPGNITFQSMCLFTTTPRFEMRLSA